MRELTARFVCSRDHLGADVDELVKQAPASVAQLIHGEGDGVACGAVGDKARPWRRQEPLDRARVA